MGEVVAGVRTRRLRNAVGALAAFLVGTAVASSAIVDGSRSDQVQDLRTFEGEFTWVAVARDGGSLDAGACDRINRLDGVLAAGGVVARVALPVLGDSTGLRAAFVTPRFGLIAWPNESINPGSQVLVGSLMGDRKQLVAGSLLYIETPSDVAPLRIDHVADGNSRVPELDGLVAFSVAPVGTVESCYVEAKPDTASAIESRLSTWDFQKPVVVTRLLPDRALLEDPAKILDAHLSQAIWLVGAAFLLAWRWFDLRLRRQEFSLYRVLGLRSTQIMTMTLAEHLLICVAPLGLGLASVAALTRPSGESLDLYVHDSLLLLGVQMLVGVLAVSGALARNPVAVFKDT